MKEIWRPIKNYEGYEISNLKRVRSFKRTIKDTKERIMTQYKDAAGNAKVFLRKNNTNTHQLIDILYFQAFESTKI